MNHQIENSRPLATSTKQVFLVEKNSDDIALARRAIARAGYAVHLEAVQTASALKDSLNSFNASPDLILVDFEHGQENETTLGLIRWLRENPATQHTPIVMISSLNKADDILKCYQSGASSVVRKPVAFTEYSMVLKDVCSYWLNISVMPHFKYIKQVHKLLSNASG